MDNKWMVFSTHSVGYVLLAAVIIAMILIFGGVVLVWSHLIDFLKEILVKYPEVKKNIRDNKVLEQVIIRSAIYVYTYVNVYIYSHIVITISMCRCTYIFTINT